MYNLSMYETKDVKILNIHQILQYYYHTENIYHA